MRRLVRETHLEPSQFVLPLFACSGEGVRREISSMPGNFQLSIDEIVKECEATRALGVGGVILFGIPDAPRTIDRALPAPTTKMGSSSKPSGP